MKKVAFTILAIIFTVNMSAQYSRLTLGIKGGVNVSNSSQDYDDIDKSAKIGFTIGSFVEYNLLEGFYVQSGLYFTTKGTKYKGLENSTGWNQTINQMYIQVPVTGAYKFYLTNSTLVYINAGPYIGYGVGGKSTIKSKASEKEDIESDTFGDDGLKEFDFGITVGVGAEFGKMVVGINCDLGLTDISRKDPGSTEKLDYKNRSSALTVGYKF